MEEKNIENTENVQSEEPVTPLKKALGIARSVFTYIVVALAIAMMIFTIISVNTFDRSDRDFFGYKAFIVRTDSMKKTDFDAGDLAVIKEVDPTTLKEGDIIAFYSADPNSLNETFTHKIRSATHTDEGDPAFVTYGTTTGVDDEYPVPYQNILGKYQFAMPKVGSFFTFLKTVPGYICCILIPFLLLIVMQGINSIRLFRQYKAEQMEEIEKKHKEEMDALAAEREKIAAEREESQKMLEELKRMQEKMAKKE